MMPIIYVNNCEIVYFWVDTFRSLLNKLLLSVSIKNMQNAARTYHHALYAKVLDLHAWSLSMWWFNSPFEKKQGSIHYCYFLFWNVEHVLRTNELSSSSSSLCLQRCTYKGKLVFKIKCSHSIQKSSSGTKPRLFVCLLHHCGHWT